MQLMRKIREGRLAQADEGFTMVVAIMVLFVSSLLVAAALVAANGDINLTRSDTTRKKAYYAAVAGISAYQFQLSSNPNYWIKCPGATKVKVAGTTDEEYTVKTLPSSSHATCESEKQATILETTGTFRVESIGTSSGVSRRIVATFTHPGFLNYVYFSNYEVEDPTNFSPEPTNCEHYYKYRVEHSLTGECGAITFIAKDKVNGPMHTNDSANVCSGTEGPVFGRTEKDVIEMNEGHYATGSCGNTPKFLGKYTETAPTLLPPETDAELLESANYKFSGKTLIVLKSGSPNMMKVTTYNSKHEPAVSEKAFPANGVVYIENGKEACAVKYTPFGSDYVNDWNCGNVYISGTYTESLTVAAAGDVIINGNLTTAAEASGKPTGGATLGLIATNFVRVYHPVKTNYETTNKVPETKTPIKGKCVTEKELSAEITNGSTTVKNIATSGLLTGSEAEGTVAGQIEAGTTISSVGSEAEKKLVLSKAAKTLTKEVSAEITSGSTTVKGIATSGLSVGDEVEGTIAGQIESGTTISSVGTEAEKKVVLSKAAKKTEKPTKLKFHHKTETTKIKFYIPITGFEYNSALATCHKTESGYSEYRESENRYIMACETGTTYEGGGFCEYENTSKSCSSKATNLNEAEDPNKLGGAQKDPVIDAAILSTHHSFIVDNYKCGAGLGELTVWGSIAQFWRGPVGTGSGNSGYIKNYNYDDRLAQEQPPNFLSPSTTSWHLSRETQPPE